MLWLPPYSLALKISVHSTEVQLLPQDFLLFLFCPKLCSGFQSPFCHLPADWRYWGINSPTSSPQPMADGSWGTYTSDPLCLGWAVPRRVIWADSQSSPGAHRGNCIANTPFINCLPFPFSLSPHSPMGDSWNYLLNTIGLALKSLSSSQLLEGEPN